MPDEAKKREAEKNIALMVQEGSVVDIGTDFVNRLHYLDGPRDERTKEREQQTLFLCDEINERYRGGKPLQVNTGILIVVNAAIVKQDEELLVVAANLAKFFIEIGPAIRAYKVLKLVEGQ